MKEVFDAIERAHKAGLKVTVEMRVTTNHIITVRGKRKDILGSFVIYAFNDNNYRIDYAYVSAKYPQRAAQSAHEMIDNFERGDYKNRMDWK